MGWGWRAGETAWQFRVVVALTEDWGCVPSIHVIAHSHPNRVPGDLLLSSDLHGHQASKWYTHIHTEIHAHRIKKKKCEKMLGLPEFSQVCV